MKRIMVLIVLLVMVLGLLAQTAVQPAGEGTETNPYQIATWQNLYWLSQNSGSWDKHFIQTEDIDFADATPAIETWSGGGGWTPIGRYIDYDIPLYVFFTGKYNGNNKIISGLFINRPWSDYQGFFGQLDAEAEITNLGLISVNVTGDDYTGGLAGIFYGRTFTNCYITGNVTGEGLFTGGLVGNNSFGTITNCYSTANVTGTTITGGLVGNNSHGSITNCYSTGNVMGITKTGGLVGDIWTGIITNSYYNYESVLINNNHIITIGALTNELFTAWFPNKSLNIDNYLSSDGSNYLINNVNDFKTLSAFSQFPYCFKLNSHLDLNTENNFYIPYFTGTFNGNGYTTLTLQSICLVLVISVYLDI